MGLTITFQILVGRAHVSLRASAQVRGEHRPCQQTARGARLSAGRCVWHVLWVAAAAGARLCFLSSPLPSRPPS